MAEFQPKCRPFSRYVLLAKLSSRFIRLFAEGLVCLLFLVQSAFSGTSAQEQDGQGKGESHGVAP